MYVFRYAISFTIKRSAFLYQVQFFSFDTLKEHNLINFSSEMFSSLNLFHIIIKMSLLANWCRYFFGKAFFNFFLSFRYLLLFLSFIFASSFRSFLPFFLQETLTNTIFNCEISLSFSSFFFDVIIMLVICLWRNWLLKSQQTYFVWRTDYKGCDTNKNNGIFFKSLSLRLSLCLLWSFISYF